MELGTAEASDMLSIQFVDTVRWRWDSWFRKC